jgi:hypothetical protein
VRSSRCRLGAAVRLADRCFACPKRIAPLHGVGPIGVEARILPLCIYLADVLCLLVSVTFEVGEFAKGNLGIGFTRGYTQSQAFGNHFGPTALIQPKPPKLLCDTSAQAGTHSRGIKYTYEDEYEWLGLTAREKIFAVLNTVIKNKSLVIDVFAYDLNEADIRKSFSSWLSRTASALSSIIRKTIITSKTLSQKISLRRSLKRLAAKIS